MLIFIVVVYIIFGICMGSFLWKLSDGSSMNLKKRSQCAICSHVLHPYELMPIISRVVQGGRCRNCKNKISVNYLLSELLSGFVFAIIGYVVRVFPMVIQLQVVITACLFLYLCFYDVRKKELSLIPFVFLCISIVGLYLSFFSWDSGSVYATRIELGYIPYEQYYGILREIGISVSSRGGMWFLVWLLGVGIYYNKHGSFGQGFGFGDVLFACILGSCIPYIMAIVHIHHGGAEGLYIEYYGMRSIGLIIYHILFSSVLGIIGYGFFRKNEFAFLPYMMGGFFCLAIAIYMFPNYFTTLLGG